MYKEEIYINKNIYINLKIKQKEGNFTYKSFSIVTRGGGGPATLGGGGALRVGQIGWVPHLSAYEPEQESGFWLIS